MKKVILTESDKQQILSEREQAIINNFNKTFNSIKRVDENELDEISPELKHRAFDKASDDFQKYGNETGGEHNQLKSNRRMAQAHSFQQIHPSIQKEVNDIAPYVIPGGKGKVAKDFYDREPVVYLSFENKDENKFCGYVITKDQIKTMSITNVYPPDNISRRVERLAYKIQKIELPDLGGEKI